MDLVRAAQEPKGVPPDVRHEDVTSSYFQIDIWQLEDLLWRQLPLDLCRSADCFCFLTM